MRAAAAKDEVSDLPRSRAMATTPGRKPKRKPALGPWGQRGGAAGEHRQADRTGRQIGGDGGAGLTPRQHKTGEHHHERLQRDRHRRARNRNLAGGRGQPHQHGEQHRQDAATIRRASDVVAAADAVVCEVCISMTPMLRDIAVNGGRYAMDEGRFRRVVRYPRQSEPSIWWTVPNESDPVRADRAAMDRCRSGHLPFARR